MHLVLLSGGSGKRLWPLSNGVSSKQFLKVLDGPNGKKESMAQRVFSQIKKSGKFESMTVIAGESQRDLLQLQLGDDAHVILEPERRDTFPAIMLASAYISDITNHDKDAKIVIMPVDPFVDDDYFDVIASTSEVLDKTDAELVLLGAKPDSPSDKFGYIVPESANVDASGSSKVASFKEKPDEATAKELISKGALWNCGVFALKLDVIRKKAINNYGIETFTFDEVYEKFSTLTKTSFDYEVVEKTNNIRVVPYAGLFKDLGTWESLSSEMSDATSGNVYIENSANTHVINDTQTPVVVLGIEDAIVVSSYDGILVAKKDETSGLKDALAQVHERAMQETRRWGYYRVIDFDMDSEIKTLTKRLHINAGKGISYQYHEHRKEIWAITAGEGILRQGDFTRNVKTGDVILIGEREWHAISAITPIDIIEVQTGTIISEDDIFRSE
ncbi:MAG: mannose-1-phosphate guanylyltransferase [Clostridiales Family XIII bacterium]|nr:mannose-1-phosphate guanylyltransferase [Clostridiales Family XIII bacterium]